jgi:hypothetical protein
MDWRAWLDYMGPVIGEFIRQHGGWFLPLCFIAFIMLLKHIGAADDLLDELPSGRIWTANPNRSGVDVGHMD